MPNATGPDGWWPVSRWNDPAPVPRLGPAATGDSQVFIQTEETPNPATLKFLPGRDVLADGTKDFADAAAAGASPLAGRLFGVPGVARVFLGRDFVSVTRTDDTDWQMLKPLVLSAVIEHYASGAPALRKDATPAAAPADGDSEVVAQIKELLDTRVRPVVAQDGGDIVFERFESGIVYLNMQGACSGCPSSTATLKSGVENMLRHYVPEVVEVRQA